MKKLIPFLFFLFTLLWIVNWLLLPEDKKIHIKRILNLQTTTPTQKSVEINPTVEMFELGLDLAVASRYVGIRNAHITVHDPRYKPGMTVEEFIVLTDTIFEESAGVPYMTFLRKRGEK